ncbi:hypothetical protein CKN81_08650 [Carnobacterium divergens]|nr:hypothetical protein CKN81_08650 [Carnobacterium divergens]
MKAGITMKIKEITIYGYGKWVDQRFDSLADLQIFYGKNEAGKSTLMAFIHSILFGFPTKQSSELRYEPRKGSRYGGRLRIVTRQYGELDIERIKGKGNGKLTLTKIDGTKLPETVLNELVSGIDKATYQALFSFNLLELQKISQLNQEKLNRYFLSIGTMGNERYLKIADRFKQEASKLYKQTGRVPEINKKIVEIRKKEKQLKTVKAQNNQYNQLVNQKLELEQSINQLRTKQQTIETHLEKLNELTNNWQYFVEMKAIQKQISEAQLKKLPEDGLYQLQHFNQELQQIKNETIKKEEQLSSLTKELAPSKELDFYETHNKNLTKLLETIPTIEAYLVKEQQANQKNEQLFQQIQQEYRYLNLAIDTPIPLKLSNEQLEKLRELQVRQDFYTKEQQSLSEKHKQLNFENNALNQQLDQVERLLWENQQFQQVEEFYSVNNAQRQPAQPTTLSFTTIFMQLVGFISIGLGFISSRFFILFGLALIAVSGYRVLSLKAKKKKNTLDAPAYSYEEFIRQQELRKQWRELLAKSDEVTISVNQVTQKLEEMTVEKQGVLLEINQVQSQWQLPKQYAITDFLSESDPFELIRQLKNEFTENQRIIQVINDQFQVWLKKAEFLKSVVVADWNHVSAVLIGIKHLVKAIEEEFEHQNKVKATIEELNQEKSDWLKKNKIYQKKRIDLFQLVYVQDEESFRKKFLLNDQLKSKKARVALLENQIAINQELLETFRDEQELQDAIQEQKQELSQQKITIEEMINQKIQCEVALKNLEEGGQYSVLLQEFANLKLELQDLVDKWSSYQIAADLIERSLTYAKKDRLPQTLQDATTYFKLLTNENYHRILLSENQIQVQHHEGLIFDVSELSQGTAEQLYIALRFAFIKNAADLIQMPILIDDGFVNFDFDRQEQMLKLIQKMSESNQVLYFTCDKKIQDVFPKEQVKVLQ